MLKHYWVRVSFIPLYWNASLKPSQVLNNKNKQQQHIFAFYSAFLWCFVEKHNSRMIRVSNYIKWNFMKIKIEFCEKSIDRKMGQNGHKIRDFNKNPFKKSCGCSSAGSAAKNRWKIPLSLKAICSDYVTLFIRRVSLLKFNAFSEGNADFYWNLRLISFAENNWSIWIDFWWDKYLDKRNRSALFQVLFSNFVIIGKIQ